MNKKAIKKFAIWAKKNLINSISKNAIKMEFPLDENFDLIVEKTAYGYFKRIIALRYMDINGFLPEKVDVFNQNNISQINKLKLSNAFYYLPDIIEKIDAEEVDLFPEILIESDGLINKLIKDLDPNDWVDNVQILGWLYQFYFSEKHEQVIDVFKGKVIKKLDIPAATQIFTPEWIVEYIVDNSLARYWLERTPESKLKNDLNYYINTDQEINEFLEPINLQDIKVFDPCVGAGHFLVYAFEMLMKIYLEKGWSKKDAAISIIKNNLYGLDIDDKAVQLAHFALLMKAKKYGADLTAIDIKKNILSFYDFHGFDQCYIEHFAATKVLEKNLLKLSKLFNHAREIGSILKVDDIELDLLEQRLDQLIEIETYNLENTKLRELLHQAKLLKQKYEIVITNPPFMNKYDKELKSYIQKHYKAYKGDLFSVFIARNLDLATPDGYVGFLTPMVWMFIKSYQALRELIIQNKSIVSLIQFEYSAFEEATVPICSFILKNNPTMPVGHYIKLSDYKGGMEVQKEITEQTIKGSIKETYYKTHIGNSENIPGLPIAFWASNQTIKVFKENDSIDKILDVRQGLATTDNKKFLRMWWEVKSDDIFYDAKTPDDFNQAKYKWAPYNKGGDRRNWYGNYDYIVNWSHDGKEIKENVLNKYSYLKSPDFVVKNTNYYFREAITWGLITSGGFSARYRKEGSIHDVAGMSAFSQDQDELLYILAIVNSKLSDYIFKMLNPTLNLQVGDFKNFPVVDDARAKESSLSIVRENIELAKEDWDSYETSWDFKRNPLI